MSKSIPCSYSASILSAEQAKKLPRTAISHEWHGSLVSPPLLFSLGLDPEALWFTASRAAAPQCNLSLTCGSFVEGLWEKELAEVFICSAGGTRYLEINLSPTGAWWSCSFHSYRARDSSAALGGVTALAETLTAQAKGWEATLRIPTPSIASAVPFTPKGAEVRANVSGVVLTETSPLYLSYSNLEATQPDFHLTDKFSALLILGIAD
jgi:hypothetical protein